jgi:hypothetical protein
MKILEKAFRALRSWAGLGDPAESRLTPVHGWLLPVAADARRQVAAAMVRRAGRRDARDGRA